jgi:two-component system, OmpR family, response regulator MprA
METPRRILYVDDDPDSCEMMATLLSLDCKQCAVSTARTAGDALTAMSERAFDLYIFDLRMPVIDGLELCGRVRQQDSNVPIMIYSALAQTDDRDSAKRAGADMFLVKPNDIEVLPDVVRGLLGVDRAAN